MIWRLIAIQFGTGTATQTLRIQFFKSHSDHSCVLDANIQWHCIYDVGMCDGIPGTECRALPQGERIRSSTYISCSVVCMGRGRDDDLEATNIHVFHVHFYLIYLLKIVVMANQPISNYGSTSNKLQQNYFSLHHVHWLCPNNILKVAKAPPWGNLFIS